MRRIDDNGQIVLPKKFISCMEREGAISYFDVPIPIADFEKKYLKTDGTFDI